MLDNHSYDSLSLQGGERETSITLVAADAALLDHARRLDMQDPLAPFRACFDLPSGVIYLDGNSLGALPHATAGVVETMLRQQWGRGLIRSWSDAGWMESPQRVGGKIARLIGAHADEVLVSDSTSVNLYKLLAAALAANPARHTILTEPGNFPTDLYVAQELAANFPAVTVSALPRDKIVAAASEHAIVMLTHIHYKTGERYDMAAVTHAVQARGAITLWDLSHSTGAVAVDLETSRADLAVGCGYKYLNGGPGAPAFLYVARRHQAQLRSPIAGWLGHAAPFSFEDDYVPARGVLRFQCGTPPMLSLAALEAGVDLFLQADMAMVTRKSASLCNLFIRAVEAGDVPHLRLVTPRDPGARGSHISFAHPDGHRIMQHLIARGVIGDFRTPDVMRFGFAALYNTHEEAWLAAQALRGATRNL